MQAKLLSEQEVQEFHPETTVRHAPKSLVDKCERRGKHLFAPAGTIIDDPNCWRLVLMGIAEPADDECRARTMQTDTQRAAALHAAARLAAGIAPEDFALFDKGYISGYNDDGSYKPGPNWAEYEQSKKDAEKEDDI